MSKMIGKKSNKDWDKAPFGATHTFRHKYEHAHPQDGYYQLKDGKIYYWRTVGSGWWDVTTHSYLELAVYCVSKEEDLEMTKEVTKQVRSVDDLEVGMFIRWNSHMDHCYVVSKPKQIISLNTGEVYNYGKDSCWTDDNFYTSSWSYTYNGEYTPIVKDTVETEAERKIRELEETIELAQKQLREYKEMK